MTLVAGSNWSAPVQPVSKMFQPPSAGGFFEARRRRNPRNRTDPVAPFRLLATSATPLTRPAKSTLKIGDSCQEMIHDQTAGVQDSDRRPRRIRRTPPVTEVS